MAPDKENYFIGSTWTQSSVKMILHSGIKVNGGFKLIKSFDLSNLRDAIDLLSSMPVAAKDTKPFESTKKLARALVFVHATEDLAPNCTDNQHVKAAYSRAIAIEIGLEKGANSQGSGTQGSELWDFLRLAVRAATWNDVDKSAFKGLDENIHGLCLYLQPQINGPKPIVKNEAGLESWLDSMACRIHHLMKIFTKSDSKLFDGTQCAVLSHRRLDEKSRLDELNAWKLAKGKLLHQRDESAKAAAAWLESEKVGAQTNFEAPKYGFNAPGNISITKESEAVTKQQQKPASLISPMADKVMHIVGKKRGRDDDEEMQNTSGERFLKRQEHEATAQGSRNAVVQGPQGTRLTNGTAQKKPQAQTQQDEAPRSAIPNGGDKSDRFTNHTKANQTSSEPEAQDPKSRDPEVLEDAPAAPEDAPGDAPAWTEPPAGLYTHAESGFTQGQVFYHGLVQGRSQAFPQGHAQGLATGHAQGLDQGRAQGYDQGFANGADWGLAVGFARGLARARAEGHDHHHAHAPAPGREH